MEHVARAVRIVGSQRALADALGVKQPTVSEWVRGVRPVPPKQCVAIELATRREVMRWDLRPDWRQLWPEMAARKGAPDAGRAAA